MYGGCGRLQSMLRQRLQSLRGFGLQSLRGFGLQSLCGFGLQSLRGDGFGLQPVQSLRGCHTLHMRTRR